MQLMKRPIRLWFAVVALTLTALTCTTQVARAKGLPHFKSGIVGQVTISPLCPVVGPGHPCPTNEGPSLGSASDGRLRNQLKAVQAQATDSKRTAGDKVRQRAKLDKQIHTLVHDIAT